MGHPIAENSKWAMPSKIPVTTEGGINGIIRCSRIDDFKELGNIYSKVYDKSINPDGYNWTPNEASKMLRSLYEEQNALGLVFEIETETKNTLLGGVLFRTRKWTEGKTVAEMEEIFVDPEYQKKGIGKELQEWALVYAAKWRGIENLSLITWEGGKPIEWYKKVGFESQRLVVMEGKLEEVLEKTKFRGKERLG